MKISIIGSGNVGGTLAQRVVESNLSDVVLVDIIEGVSAGKAFDLADAHPILKVNRKIEGTTDYAKIGDSDIVVITAGLARQPGMSREDLLKKNAATIKKIITEVVKYAPNAIVLMVTNPLDILTYVALKSSGFKPKKVIGMGGILDSTRFANLIAKELNVCGDCIQALVIGAHGKKMIPLVRYCSIAGISITEFLAEEKLNKIIAATVNRGTQIVSLLGRGSAYYAPSAAAFLMIKAILEDEQRLVSACAYLDGEYGLKDICIGVPVKLGRNGIEEIIQLKLTDKEHKELVVSAESIKLSITNILDGSEKLF